MAEVVSEALATGTVGGLVLCTSVSFALIVSLFSDRVNRRFRKVLRALRTPRK